MRIPKAGRMTVEKFRVLRDKAYADFNGPVPRTNQRAARCRVCRKALKKGEGIGYFEFMEDGYRGNAKYVCHSCEEKSRPRGGVT